MSWIQRDVDDREATQDSPPPPVTRKLIVAADGPWTGELYSTRPGRGRVGFASAESFCAALLVVTDWPLLPQSNGAEVSPLSRATARRRGPRPRCAEQSHTRKFIVAASRPWSGEMYRTRPGLGHLHFGTFEQFLRAVMDITGWSLER